jgi:neutral ceramidase
VTSGPVSAGAAEMPLELPVSTALGGYTFRSTRLGNAGRVDSRHAPLSASFNPSIGIETLPKVKAVALTAGEETIVWLRTDSIFADDTLLYEVQEVLGPDLAGKVAWSTTHSHNAPEQYTASSLLQLGGGVTRKRVRDRLRDKLVEAAQAALAAREPAQIGIALDADFDPENYVTHDRRGEDNELAGGSQKDSYLWVIRVDRADGSPLAILPIFGIHGTSVDAYNALQSCDVAGGIERVLEEQFDSQVTVMHLQGAGGDVSPGTERHVDPGSEPDMDWARGEDSGRRALPFILAVWEQAGQNLRSELAMEMVTRTIPLGPDWRTFTIRGGALAYAPFEPGRGCDGEVYDDQGQVLSPLDEFNAPAGAALCGEVNDSPLAALVDDVNMPGVGGLTGYASCALITEAVTMIGPMLNISFEQTPICATTRTTVSSLRLGDHLVAFGPGEVVTLWADYIRAHSPVARDRTIVVGYSQGHVGYLLTVEDWLLGGYEPSINVWGPLEGEYIGEKLVEVMALAVTDDREDAAAGGVDRLRPAEIVDDLTVDPAPLAGTVPDTFPETVYVFGGEPLTSAQPDPIVPRVTGMATFVWIGEDPLAGTPRITLERETAPGVFETVRRRSGRPVEDLDVLLIWTPEPLRSATLDPRTHYWAAQWQPVTWLGATSGSVPGQGDLDERAGLELGSYRFHVEGTGYVLDSEPFEVVAGPLTVTATVSGPSVQVTAAYEALKGWRLLAMTGLSNRALPIAVGPLRVEIDHAGGGGTETFTDVALTGPGAATVTPTSVDDLTAVRVFDRFGNVGDASPL